MKDRKVKKVCLCFGEGGREKIFFTFLSDSKRFKERFPEWKILQGSAWGESCRNVLTKCLEVIKDRRYDLVLCFIDTDKLYGDFPNTHEEEKRALEELANQKVVIIWQETNHEEELSRATNGKINKKNGMKGRLKRHSTTLLNSSFVKKIFTFFQ